MTSKLKFPARGLLTSKGGGGIELRVRPRERHEIILSMRVSTSSPFIQPLVGAVPLLVTL